MIRDIISNEEVKEFFKNELKLDKNSGTYLFYGSDMNLLMEFALYFAKGLCCEVLEGDFCGECSTCKRIDKLLYSDLEILELGREERNISMAQMMIQEREPVEKIERYTGYALEKLKEISNGIGIPLMK